jgi:hypothetical protein
MLLHVAAAASQKSTCPTVTGLLPDFTFAVSATTLPEVTDAIPVPEEVMVRVVVVGATSAEARARKKILRSEINRSELTR